MPILYNDQVYDTLTFTKEDEFEKTVERLSDFLFGAQTIYISVKKRIRAKDIVTIPDGYLLDMTIVEDPKLFIIENEIVRHDPFQHIGIQLLKFVTSFDESKVAIRKFLMEEISANPEKLKRLEKACEKSTSRNIDNYLDKAVFGYFKGIVLIDEAKPELHLVLEKINADISVLELKAYISDKGDVLYRYDSLYEDDEEIEVMPRGAQKANRKAVRAQRRRRRAEADTIIVPAREEGFQETFIGDSEWYAIRIGAAMKSRIKYIAAYRIAPISAVTHLAEIQDIKPYKDTGKYIVHFKGEPEEIRHIPVRESTNSPQGPVYVQKEKLLNSQYLEEALES